MRNIHSLLLFSFLLTVSYQVNAQEWKKIVPLKSTRAEVEAILGVAQGHYSAIYQLKEGSLFIEYSSGPCRPDRNGGWDVAENVVVQIGFSPKHKRRLATLNLNRKKFRRVASQHLPGVVNYVNDEDGVSYEIQEGKVDSVHYYPPQKYDYLYCDDARRKVNRRD